MVGKDWHKWGVLLTRNYNNNRYTLRTTSIFQALCYTCETFTATLFNGYINIIIS